MKSPTNIDFTYDVTYCTINSAQDGIGRSQIIPVILKLADRGLRVHLISFEYQQRDFNLVELLQNKKIKWTALKKSRFRLPGGLERLWQISKAISNTRVIHARSDFAAVAAALSRKAPFLWDVRSLWSDQRRFMSDRPIEKFGFSILRIFESIAAKNCAAYSTLTNAVQPILRKRNPYLTLESTVVSTIVDTEKFIPIAKKSEKLIISFSGNYHNYYDLDISRKFVEAMRELCPMEVVWLKPKNANPLSLGIPDEKQIQAAADRIPQIIAATTFGVAICKMNAGDSLLASMPTKIAEYLSCGIPVVVNGGLGDFDVLIKKYRAGVVIEEDSEEAIRSASIELWGVLNDAETPQRCRELVINHLTLEAGVDSYFKIYEKLIGRQFFS